MLQETQVFSHQRGFVSALVCNIVVVCECHAGGKCIDHDDDDDDDEQNLNKKTACDHLIYIPSLFIMTKVMY